MAKFLTLYFENFDKSYDNFEKEGLNLDNLLFKTSFGFGQGKLNFNSKSVFAKDGSINHDYGLKLKDSTGTFTFKSNDAGELSLETDNKCLSKDDLNLFAYSKFVFTPAEGLGNKKLEGNVMLRFHHRDNLLVSLGLEKWNAFAAPKAISAYGSFGFKKDNITSSLSGHVKYDIEKKSVVNGRVVVHGSQGDLNGYLQVRYDSPKPTEKPTEGQNLEEQNSEKNDKKKVEDNVKVTLKVHKQVKPCLKTGLVVNYGVNSKEVDASLHASKQVDNVRINAKVDTKNTLTYGFTHTKDDLTLGFTAENQLLNDATEQNDKIVVTNHWGKFKFGLSAEYNRI